MNVRVLECQASAMMASRHLQTGDSVVGFLRSHVEEYSCWVPTALAAELDAMSMT